MKLRNLYDEKYQQFKDGVTKLRKKIAYLPLELKKEKKFDQI